MRIVSVVALVASVGLLLVTACGGGSAAASTPAPALTAPPAPAWTRQTAFYATEGEGVRLYGVGLYDLDGGEDVRCDGRIVMDATERRAVAEMSKALTAEQSEDGGALITRAASTVQRARLEKAWFDGRVAFVLVSVPFDAAPPGWPEHAPRGGMYRVEVESAVRQAGKSLAVNKGLCGDDVEQPSGCCP